MAGRPERDALGRIGRVGPDVVVRADQPVDVDQVGRVGRAPGTVADRHRASSCRPDRATPGYDRRPLDCMDRAGRGVVQIERQAAWPARRPKVTRCTTTTTSSPAASAPWRRRAPATAAAARPARTVGGAAGSRSRWRWRPSCVLAIVATTAAGAAVIGRLAEGYPGHPEPRPAAGRRDDGVHDARRRPPRSWPPWLQRRRLAGRDRDRSRRPTAARARARPSTSADPPAHGYVIPGSLLPDGQVIMVVDQRVGATGVGDCFGDPMP